MPFVLTWIGLILDLVLSLRNGWTLAHTAIAAVLTVITPLVVLVLSLELCWYGLLFCCLYYLLQVATTNWSGSPSTMT